VPDKPLNRPAPAELYVAGPRLIAFVTKSRTTARWALGRSTEAVRVWFVERFGSLDVPVAEFRAGPASHVRIEDLSVVLPAVASALRE